MISIYDDLCGLGSHSCMDLLHESRLLNYFGKVSANDLYP